MRGGKHAPTRFARGGFTLIEVVLAMGLLLLGATVILGLLTFGAALGRTASLRTISAEATEAIVADLEERLFPLEEDGSAGDPVPVVLRPVPGVPGLSYSATAVPEPAPDGGAAAGASREYRVDVEVTWRGGVSSRGRRFSVLLLREVPFGERMRSTFRRTRAESPPPPPSATRPELE
jgi:hypothetical protein